jgi:hypothetical protein
MTLYALKPKFQALLRPQVERLAARGVTANQVTLLAALVSVLVGALVAGFHRTPVIFLLLPVWLFARMALNAVDGMLAREFGQQSRLGGYLNELCDIVSDAALVLPFVLLPALRAMTAWSCSTATGPPAARAKGAIVLFHRGHEHGGRVAHLVDELDLPDFAFYAWDARGHGRSPGERGHSPSFAAIRCAMSTDLRRSYPRPTALPCRHRRRRPERRRGAGATWVHDYAPRSARWCSPRRPSA